MPASAAQIAANRRNAAQSTGPRSNEGKMKSRANALKHGLCAAVVVPAVDPAVLHERTVGVYETICPQTAFQAWTCSGIALITIRLDRVWALEKQVRDGVAWRAIEFWDEDQRTEADRIARRLAHAPSRTVGQLRRSAAGCDWLIECWAFLADAAYQGPWTDEQTNLAHDLLGTPPEFRDNAPGRTINLLGQAIEPSLTEIEIARQTLDELNAHRTRVVEADAIARHLAEADLDDLNNRDLSRLRRYERSLQNDLHRYWAMSHHQAPSAAMPPKFRAAIPAEFLDPAPSPVKNEPNPTPVAVGNEANSVPPVVRNEPNPVPVVVKNEAKSVPIVRNEANLAQVAVGNEANSAPHAVRNEANLVPTGRPTRSFSPASVPMDNLAAGLSPELRALLREEDLPDPDDLDTDWCRQYIAENLKITPSGQVQVRSIGGEFPPEAFRNPPA